MPEVEHRAVKLLDAVHLALSTARYESLQDLSDALSHEMTLLVQEKNAGVLAAIQRRAERNAVCLLAAQRGLRAARRRIDEIKAAGKSLVTYDNKGRRAEVSTERNLAQRY